MKALPTVLLDPSFRTMDEIFDDPTRRRLETSFDPIWARDEPMPNDEFVAAAGSADAIVFGGWRHGPGGLAAVGPRCRALLEVAGGHEHVGLDYRQALNRGLLVGSCAPAFGPAVAEHGLALALAAVRGIVKADRAIRRGDELWLHAGNADNTSLLGARIGFVGCGGISRSLQPMLEPFSTSIFGYDPPLGSGALRSRDIEPVDLPEMFAQCDVIFVMAPPTSENRHLISRDLLAVLSPHQTLVLLSRGSLVDFEAVSELGGRDSFRFATDVYPEEPIAPDSPIRSFDNTLRTPHLAGALPVALHEIGRCVVADLEAIFDGLEPTRLQYLTESSLGGLVQDGQAPNATTAQEQL